MVTFDLPVLYSPNETCIFPRLFNLPDPDPHLSMRIGGYFFMRIRIRNTGCNSHIYDHLPQF